MKLVHLNSNLQSDILKVGHHGSRTSTSPEFLSRVKPKVAVISAGLNNKFQHPHVETLNNLQNYTNAIYGTWISGNIVISTNGSTYQINSNKTVPVSQKQEEHVTNDEQTQNNEASSNSGIIIKSIDLEDEVVTIQNTSNKDMNLTGWKLVSVNGNQVYNFPSGYTIKAGSTITIVSGKATGDLKWSGSYIWNNDSDSGELYDANGNLVSKYQ